MKRSFLGLILSLGLVGAIHLDVSAQSKGVHGRVKTKDGAPIESATVTIMGLGKSTSTSSDGSFQFSNLSDGTYTIRIKSIGNTIAEQIVTVKDGKASAVNIAMNISESQLEQVEVLGYNSHNNQKVHIGKAGIIDKDLPQSVQIINEQVIADQQVNRLSDALKNANGVALGANRGGVNENFYARGYSLGANNIFKNGIRTNNSASIEASTLESIEILKGSAALLYGGVSGGAVINMVTKKPKFNYGGEVSFRTGSYDFYKPTVDVYGPLSKTVAFRLIGTYENAKSFRDVVENKRTYVNPSLLIKASEKTEIEINGDYMKANNTPDFGIGTIDGKIDQSIGRKRFLNTVWAFNDTEQANFQTALNHKFNDNWKLNIALGAQSYNRDYFGAERVQIQANGDLNIALNKTRSKEITMNQQVNLTGKFYTAGIKHTILVGADADQSDVKNFAFKISDKGNVVGVDGKTKVYDLINIYQPGGERTDIPDASFKNSTRTDIYRSGVFVQDLIELSEKFKVLAGVRYTYQKTPESRIIDNQGNHTLTENKPAGPKIDKAWSPKFGLIYQPISSSSIFVTYASNFEANSGYDREYRSLGPSIIDQYEFGVKNEFMNGRLTANASVYRIKNNRFAQAIISEDGTIKDALMKEFTGETASDGVELDLRGQLAEGLNIIAGYSYNFRRYTKTSEMGNAEGERQVGSTPHTANGTIFYTLQNGSLKGLKLGFSSFYTGRRNAGWNNTKANIRDGVNRLISVSPFTTIDFSAGYTYKNWSILGKLSNITNAFNYYIHENYSVNPIPPRSFMATLSYKFEKR
ncbi:TonB-dependent receptor [Sphingobacterium sp. HMA12]|uniref:TonB-dependent receptor n=1 Tax=Sphingobacterium sp. HMA12 TaxID=2050894 RepID=UPI001F17464B|nr:TonB-dependent receptor [Sphingobacterium sp. HMA12]